ncbi:MAG TPA: AAA family ATPase [Solirubrobacteraceae bacterium]|nr:AAA family ATPase [Solirubrobacteraceae bacterium]
MTFEANPAAGRLHQTLLVTDIVRSTEHLARLGDRRWKELLERHDAIVHEALSSTGGRVLSDRGDGFLMAFDTPAPALRCAEEICVATAGLGVELRAGVHAGECELLGDRLAGMAVHVTARIAEQAGGSEVLASADVVELLGANQFEFADCGEFELRGVPGRWAVHALQSERLAAVAGSVEVVSEQVLEVPLPPMAAARLAESRLVNRLDEVARCFGAFERVRRGELHTVFIVGEPGIGKTRLAAEVADMVHRSGATVLCGRCDAELGVPYQPFVEVMTHYARFAPPELLAQHRARYGRELARLVPELGGPALAPGGTPEQSREENRHVMFAAVAGLLRTAALQRPLALMLDDLQWADRPTLLMLKYLLLNPEPIGALVVGTYRSTEVARAQPLAELLLELRREPGVEQIELTGLEPNQCVAMAVEIAEEDLDSSGLEFVRALGQATNGNPFFLGEIVRSLKESGGVTRAAHDGSTDGGAVDVPQSVRETIARRVAGLGERVEQALRAASVIGREFDVELLARMVGVEEEQLIDVLDVADAAELITEVPGIGMRYSFVHPLIPPALYEQLGGGRRRRLHRQALEGLEQLLGDSARAQRRGELAYHALAGVPMVSADKAVGYARDAGHHALEQLAPQEAVRWFDHALTLHQSVAAEDGGSDSDGLQCDLLIGRGIAAQQSGDPEFRETLLKAAELARTRGDTARLVRAVLANTRGFVSETGRVDTARVALIEAALDAIGPRDSADRARLLATLSAELTFAGDWRRRKALSDESLELATRLGDPMTLSEVLSHRFITIWTPETLAQRIDDTERELAIAQEIGNPLAVFRAMHWRAAAAVEAGELDLAAELVKAESEVADRLQRPTASWLAAYDRSTQALMHGLLDEAERSAEDAFRIASESEQPEALAFYAGQLINIRFEQGRLAELEPLIAQQVELNPGIPAFRGALALARTEAGMRDEALEVLAVDAASGFSEHPYDSNWLAGIAIYAQACSTLGEPTAAARLYELLEPWEDHVAFNSATTWGLVQRLLGNLERVLGRYEEAERKLVTAAERHEQMYAPVWLARTRVDLADLLIERGADTGRAQMLLEKAIGTARDLGCAGIERRAVALLGQTRELA